jgi:hypothetical protein
MQGFPPHSLYLSGLLPLLPSLVGVRATWQLAELAGAFMLRGSACSVTVLCVPGWNLMAWSCGLQTCASLDVCAGSVCVACRQLWFWFAFSGRVVWCRGAAWKFFSACSWKLAFLHVFDHHVRTCCLDVQVVFYSMVGSTWLFLFPACCSFPEVGLSNRDIAPPEWWAV